MKWIFPVGMIIYGMSIVVTEGWWGFALVVYLPLALAILYFVRKELDSGRKGAIMAGSKVEDPS